MTQSHENGGSVFAYRIKKKGGTEEMAVTEQHQ